MKTLKSPFVAAVWLSCLHLAPADIITLNNGEKIEGKVLRETDETYTIEVKISKTIRDEKTIAKSDVSKIDKETEDEKAFEKINAYVPTPELVSKAGYEARIERVEAFINDYPESTKIAEAKKIHDYLTEEYVAVQNGGIKFGEEMISAEDYLANSYDYDAMIAAKEITEDVGRRDFLSALRAFTKYDQTFSEASGRNEVAKLISQVLVAYNRTIVESLATLDGRVERRDSGLATMAPEDRSQTARALAEQEAQVNAAYEREKEAKEP